jgi:hypothetical protein
MEHRSSAVHLARTRSGVELPVIDVTNPAFAVGDAELARATRAFGRQPWRWLPAPLRNALFRRLLRGSLLGGAAVRARGTYLAGLDTYLLKLGDRITAVSPHPADRHIAASLPALCLRLRLLDVARLMALPPGPVRMVNIGGGTAIDSLNALLVAGHHGPARIDVLDLDEEGPAFGAAAAATFPGLQIDFRHRRHDWRDPAALASILAEAPVTVVSSEGALFEYGSDEEISGNLRVLGGVPRVVGSVTRAGPLTDQLIAAGGAAIRPRSLDAFTALARDAGWTLERSIDRPFSHQVALRPS